MTVARRVPGGVICLISALAFHELTEEIPHVVYLALPRSSRTPKLDYPPIRAFHYAQTWFDIGVEEHVFDGVAVRIFSAIKSVVDAFKYRNKIGTSVAVDSLRRLLKTRVKPTDVLKIARAGRMERVIRPYMEALTG